MAITKIKFKRSFSNGNADVLSALQTGNMTLSYGEPLWFKNSFYGSAKLFVGDNSGNPLFIGPYYSDGSLLIDDNPVSATVGLITVGPKIEDASEVAAAALNDLNLRTKALEDLVHGGDYIEVQKLVVTRELSGAALQSDWEQTDSTASNYIWNKPTIPTVPTNVSSFTNDAGYITSNDIPSETMVCIYDASVPGITNYTVQEIMDAHANGKVVICKEDSSIYYLECTAGNSTTGTITFQSIQNHGTQRAFHRLIWLNGTWSDQQDNWNSKQDVLVSGTNIKTINNQSLVGSGNISLDLGDHNVQSDWGQTDTNADDYIKNKPTIPTVNNATLTIQKNGTTIDTFTANASSDKTINITVPVNASDVSALPASTKYAAAINLSVDGSTYVVTAQLKDQDGNNLGTASTIDLPLETMVVNGSYDSSTKKIQLTLKNGNVVEFSVADLISGLQSEITAQNPLSADLLVDGTNNKVYTSTEQTKLAGIETGAEVNVQVDWSESNSSSDAFIKNKPSIPDSTSDLTNDSGFITISDLEDTSEVVAAALNDLDRRTKSVEERVSGGDSVIAQAIIATREIQAPNLANVAFSGNYSDLSNTPSIPTVPSNISAFTNDSGYITSSDLPTIPTDVSELNNDVGYITSADQVQTDWNATTGMGVLLNKPSLATVATSGSYDDLSNKPLIPDAQVNADWTESDATSKAYIQNKPTLATVATSGSYNDLSNKPTIPTVNNATLTIKQGEISLGTFTANADTNVTVTIPTPTSQVNADWNASTGVAQILNKPTNVSSFTNDAGYLTSFTETDPTVPSWAKAANKPTYSYSEITNTPSIPDSTSDLTNDSGFITIADIPAQVQSDWSETDTDDPAYIKNKPTIPTVNNATLTIQKNSATIDTFTANASSDKTINITVPTSASDVSALPASTKYAAAIDLSINSTTYVMSAQLKDQDGNNIGTADSIDLPLESMVVNGSYNSSTKKVVLTLQSGSTVEFSVADLISGLQSEITSSNKLSADLISNGTTNKIYTATEQSKLAGIEAGAEVNVQSDWNQTDTTSDDYIKNKPTNISAFTNDANYITLNDVPAQVNADWNATSGAAEILHKPTNLVQDASYVHTDNNYTTDEHNKLAGIQAGAEVNVQSDWNQTNTSADDYIKNKPTIPTVPTNVSSFINDASYITASDVPQEVVYCTFTKNSGSSNTGTMNMTLSEIAAAYAAGKQVNCVYADVIMPMIDCSYSSSGYSSISFSHATKGPNGVLIHSIGYFGQGNNNPQWTWYEHDYAGGQNNVQSDWNQTNTSADDYIKNKPTIPTVNNATLTIQKNGSTVDTFTANASVDKSINISVPTKTSDVTNDSGFITATALKDPSEVTAAALNEFNLRLKALEERLSNGDYIEVQKMAVTRELEAPGLFSGNYNDLTNKPTINNATLTIQQNGTTINTFTANASSNVNVNIKAQPTIKSAFLTSAEGSTTTGLRKTWSNTGELYSSSELVVGDYVFAMVSSWHGTQVQLSDKNVSIYATTASVSGFEEYDYLLLRWNGTSFRIISNSRWQTMFSNFIYQPASPSNGVVTVNLHPFYRTYTFVPISSDTTVNITHNNNNTAENYIHFINNTSTNYVITIGSISNITDSDIFIPEDPIVVEANSRLELSVIVHSGIGYAIVTVSHKLVPKATV